MESWELRVLSTSSSFPILWKLCRSLPKHIVINLKSLWSVSLAVMEKPLWRSGCISYLARIVASFALHAVIIRRLESHFLCGNFLKKPNWVFSKPAFPRWGRWELWNEWLSLPLVFWPISVVPIRKTSSPCRRNAWKSWRFSKTVMSWFTTVITS